MMPDIRLQALLFAITFGFVLILGGSPYMKVGFLRTPRYLCLQLFLELIEKPPVSALSDEFLWIGLDHSNFVQPQSVEA